MSASNTSKKYIWFFGIIFTIIPFISTMIYLFTYHANIVNVYLPSAAVNDEFYYYKQAEALVSGGMPAGYFGYNESTAAIGTFGAWSPVIFLIWTIAGKVIGWNYFTPIIVNLFMMTAAYLLFYLFVRPDKNQCIMVLITTILTVPVARWMLSCTPEMMLLSFLVIYFGIVLNIVKQNNIAIWKLIVLSIVAVYLSLCRPYYVLLFIPVAYLCGARIEAKKKRFLSYVLVGLVAIISMALFFVISSKFCAPYLWPIIDLSWLKLIVSNPIKGITNIIFTIFMFTKSFIMKGANGILEGFLQGCWVMQFMLLFVYFIYKFTDTTKSKVSAYHKQRLVFGFIAIAYTLMYLAIAFFYSIDEGARHLFLWDAIATIILAVIETNNKIKATAIVMLLWMYTAVANDTYYYDPPLEDANLSSVIEEGAAKLSDTISLDEAADPWDNTLVWTLDVDFQELYALPAGMGINACGATYVEEHFDELKSKYIAVKADSKTDTICIKEACTPIAEYGTTKIYQLR